MLNDVYDVTVRFHLKENTSVLYIVNKMLTL